MRAETPSTRRVLALVACASVLCSFPACVSGLSIQYLNYDANGNLIQDGVFEFVYDEANRLVKVKSAGAVVARYWYDHEGQRVKKWEDGVTTYYVGDTEVRRPDTGGEEVVNYYRANGELVAVDDGEGRKYFLNDHLGSPRVVLDSAGIKIEDIEYRPYGGVISGGVVDNKLFTGKEKDSATGLMYYGARYYNPSIGRWTQPDTVIPDVYNPQDLNRYTYVRNNPLKYTDDDGHVAFVVPLLVGAAGGMLYYHFSPGEKSAWGYAKHAGYGAAAAVAGAYAAAAVGVGYLSAAVGGAVSAVMFEGTTEIDRQGLDARIEPVELGQIVIKGALLGAGFKYVGKLGTQITGKDVVEIVVNKQSGTAVIVLKTGETIITSLEMIEQILGGSLKDHESNNNNQRSENTPLQTSNSQEEDNQQTTTQTTLPSQ